MIYEKLTIISISCITGTSDFFGLNFYTSNVVTLKSTPDYNVDYNSDTDIQSVKDPSWLG
jgi:beta-glucosidase/6-phospho-beta-glucosidase/beta-galactosidase